ncbi:MAG: AMP-binding protein [Ilumatobacteraceae bacterium]
MLAGRRGEHGHSAAHAVASLDAFIALARARIRHGDAQLLLIDDALAPRSTSRSTVIRAPSRWPPSTRGRQSTAADLVMPPDDRAARHPARYTSGSTSEPKGVMIPDRVLRANLDAIAAAGNIDARDVAVSWLPLYHDMGLVGLLALPMTLGCQLVKPPQDFLARPGHWMEWISTYDGDGESQLLLESSPPLRPTPGPGSSDLSTMRIALSGARAGRPQRGRGVPRRSHQVRLSGSGVPAFGMTGAIGAAFPPRWGMVCDTVGRQRLETDRIAVPIEVTDPDDYALKARRLPYLGTAVPGLEFRIADPETREPLPERHVGELLIRGTSVTPGYYKREDATEALFHDGWLCTGDLAYLLDGGELILCGRIKDVIIVGGRNVFPEDIERACGVLDGVRAGNVIAFGVEGYKGKESVVVVAEARTEEPEAVREAIHHRTLEVCGLPPRDVILVQPSTLPKTSSGKLQRAKCREDYLAETLTLL